MAALPVVGHASVALDTGVGGFVVDVVDDVDEVDDVEVPGAETVVDVEEIEVVVVGVPDVGELWPNRRPITSAKSASGTSRKRPNLDGNDAFTLLIYRVENHGYDKSALQEC